MAPKKKGGRKTAVEKLERYKARLGNVADDVIAEQAGLSRGVVGAYRRKLGIPAYDGYLWKPGHIPATAKSGSKPKAKAKAKARASDKPTKATKPTAAPTPRRRASRIDDFAHIVGVETDASVAEKAGVTRAAVGAWRRRMGITAAFPKGVARTEKKASPAPAPAPARAPSAPSAPSTPTAASASAAVSYAYRIQASAGEAQREVVAVGSSLPDVCRRAEQWLGSKWRIDEVRLLGDALP